MNETVKEWLAKAQADYRTSKRELEVRDGPNFDAVCFHCQQCIEKLMKALLILCGIVPPRTHDLVHLDKLLATVSASWALEDKQLRFLTRAAVDFRYPGEAAEHQEAAEAFDICTRLRARLLSRFDESS